MSEPRLISPLLDGFALGGPISSHSGVSCYPAMQNDSDERYIVKTISIPASQVQVEALLLTGAFPDADSAAVYFQELADGIRAEVEILDKLSSKRGFFPYSNYQIVPMEDGVGYEVYLLSRYAQTLDRRMRHGSMTHLGAVNLGIDVCAALAVCRKAGQLYVALKPENIFLTGDQEFRIGDIGFVPLNSLEYAALPDRYRSDYIPPEVSDAYSTLNDTMDTYALGLVLYQVYNNGKLPFENEEERKALMERLAMGENMPAPANADFEMAQIITRACAYNPGERWTDPTEMGHALITYMQRNGANDVPIAVPTEEPVIEETPAEEPAVEEIPAEEPAVEEIPAEEPAVEEAPAEEPAVEESPAEEPAVEEAPAEEAEEEITAEETTPEADPEPVETPVPEEAPADEEPEEAPAEDIAVDALAEEQKPAETGEEVQEEDAPAEVTSSDWIDKMDAFLAEDQSDEEKQADEPSLRELLDSGDYLDPDQVEAVDLTEETADMLNLAQELIDHEMPEPVVAPEPIEIPMPEPIVLEQSLQELVDTHEQEAESDEAPAQDVPGDSIPDAAPAAEEVSQPRKRGKLPKIVAGVLAAALLAFGAYYYYNNHYLLPIDNITYDANGLELTVTITSDVDESILRVVCKDTYGNTLTEIPANGVVTFTNLQPGTQYIISLEAEGFHKLVNAPNGSYTTPAQTKIIHLTTVTGQERGSMVLDFGVEGTDCEEWTLTCSAEGEEDRIVTFTGHSVTVSDLTVGTVYTCTLSASGDYYLTGAFTAQHTASDVILAEDLSVSGFSDGSITVSWNAPDGVTVERWTARCYNENGYDQITEVTDSSVVFNGIAESEAYTIEITAVNMSTPARTFVTANPVTITGVTAEYTGSQLNVTWTYDGGAPAGGWKVTYTVDNSPVEYELTSDEAKVALTLLAPSSTYHFSVTTADATTVSGENTASLRIPETKSFSANKLNTSNVSVKMYQVPETENWTYKDLTTTAKTFAPGGSLALMYKTSKNYTVTDDQYTTVFVIRDSEGNLVSISSNTRAWSDMWTNGYCVEEVRNLPAEAGEYMLDVYLNNQKLTRQTFTIE